MKSFTTIKQYIASFPKELRPVLQSVHEIIAKSIPNVEETISYGMPTFKLNGHNLVHFAAYKTHIGFYPAPSGISAFKKELSGYSTSKGCVRFPIGKPLPLNIVAKIVTFRVKEDMNHVRKEDESIFGKISAPALRALAHVKINTLKDLSKWTEKELLQLHGIGPSTIPTLKEVLRTKKLSFKK
jgi:uncharacterized protein YdhG (YjbR/CyaY superfamily)